MMMGEFEQDAGDRLNWMLVAYQIREPARFTAAARLAGRQLESLKPVALAMGPGGLSVEASVAIRPGTIPVVLADATRVLSIYLRALDDEWIAELDGAAERNRVRLPRPWVATDIFRGIELMLNCMVVPRQSGGRTCAKRHLPIC
jgi:hypothetical protein